MLRRVFRDRKEGFYIDVGAADPKADSVTKFFYDEGWSGINIEPNEFFYDKLLAERPRDINLNVAVGDREEDRIFYLFEKIGNSTFDKASNDRYRERGFESKPVVVHVATLAGICEKYVKRSIDFLKIDCEGWEGAVLSSADWDRFRPTVLIVEATDPGTTDPSWQEWEPLLLNYFEMVYFDGLNRFYLSHESGHLRSHFELPPNFHDTITMHATAEAEWASHVHLTERESLTQQLEKAQERVVGLEQQVSGLTGSLASMNIELGHARSEADAALQTVEALKTELGHQLAKLDKVEEDNTGLKSQRADLQTRVSELETALKKSRLWVGQLSQDLALAKKVH